MASDDESARGVDAGDEWEPPRRLIHGANSSAMLRKSGTGAKHF